MEPTTPGEAGLPLRRQDGQERPPAACWQAWLESALGHSRACSPGRRAATCQLFPCFPCRTPGYAHWKPSGRPGRRTLSKAAVLFREPPTPSPSGFHLFLLGQELSILESDADRA